MFLKTLPKRCLILLFSLQARELAKQYTGIEDEIKAVTEFRKVLRSRDMFFNSEAFPVNESGEEAFLLCSDSTGARAFCPKRWETLQKWINSTKHVSALFREGTRIVVMNFFVHFVKRAFPKVQRRYLQS